MVGGLLIMFCIITLYQMAIQIERTCLAIANPVSNSAWEDYIMVKY